MEAYDYDKLKQKAVVEFYAQYDARPPVYGETWMQEKQLVDLFSELFSPRVELTDISNVMSPAKCLSPQLSTVDHTEFDHDVYDFTDDYNYLNGTKERFGCYNENEKRNMLKPNNVMDIDSDNLHELCEMKDKTEEHIKGQHKHIDDMPFETKVDDAKPTNIRIANEPSHKIENQENINIKLNVIRTGSRQRKISYKINNDASVFLSKLTRKRRKPKQDIKQNKMSAKNIVSKRKRTNKIKTKSETVRAKIHNSLTTTDITSDINIVPPSEEMTNDINLDINVNTQASKVESGLDTETKSPSDVMHLNTRPVAGIVATEESDQDISERKTTTPARENKLETTVKPKQCKTSQISNDSSTLNKSETMTPTNKPTFNLDNSNFSHNTSNKNTYSVVDEDSHSDSKFDTLAIEASRLRQRQNAMKNTQANTIQRHKNDEIQNRSTLPNSASDRISHAPLTSTDHKSNNTDLTSNGSSEKFLNDEDSKLSSELQSTREEFGRLCDKYNDLVQEEQKRNKEILDLRASLQAREIEHERVSEQRKKAFAQLERIRAMEQNIIARHYKERHDIRQGFNHAENKGAKSRSEIPQKADTANDKGKVNLDKSSRQLISNKNAVIKRKRKYRRPTSVQKSAGVPGGTNMTIDGNSLNDMPPLQPKMGPMGLDAHNEAAYDHTYIPEPGEIMRHPPPNFQNQASFSREAPFVQDPSVQGISPTHVMVPKHWLGNNLSAQSLPKSEQRLQMQVPQSNSNSFVKNEVVLVTAQVPSPNERTPVQAIAHNRRCATGENHSENRKIQQNGLSHNHAKEIHLKPKVDKVQSNERHRPISPKPLPNTFVPIIPGNAVSLPNMQVHPSAVNMLTNNLQTQQQAISMEPVLQTRPYITQPQAMPLSNQNLRSNNIPPSLQAPAIHSALRGPGPNIRFQQTTQTLSHARTPSITQNSNMNSSQAQSIINRRANNVTHTTVAPFPTVHNNSEPTNHQIMPNIQPQANQHANSLSHTNPPTTGCQNTNIQVLINQNSTPVTMKSNQSVFQGPQQAHLISDQKTHCAASSSPRHSTMPKQVQFQDAALPMKCVFCHNNALFVCSRCEKQPYCSQQCQGQDWSIHKKTCETTT